MVKKISRSIYDILGKWFDMDKNIQKIKRIYTCTDSEARDRCRRMYEEKIKLILITLSSTVLLAVLLCVKSAAESHAVVLNRPGYGEDSVTKILRTEVDGKNEDFGIEVAPIEYEKSELKQIFQRGFEEIEQLYLGENDSADVIQEDLVLPERLDDVGLDVTWMSSNQSVIDSSGKLVKYDDGNTELVELTAILSYGEESAERRYEIRVVGRKLGAGEKAEKIISEYARKIQMEDKSCSQIELPSDIEGYKVEEPSTGSGGVAVIFLGLVAAASIWMGMRSKIAKMEKDRRQQLMMDYPEMIDKMILYLGAGVTVRGAFARMMQGNEESNLVRELRYTLNEIQSGVPEGEAYYNMGHRINLPVYMKLMSMLSQNVNKGTKDILIMMAGEEEAAMQTRKEIARKKGEEAGTKLLFPMMLLLGIVMVIVVLPAVMSF